MILAPVLPAIVMTKWTTLQTHMIGDNPKLYQNGLVKRGLCGLRCNHEQYREEGRQAPATSPHSYTSARSHMHRYTHAAQWLDV
jgi:hypothetical protein